ncbi:MAG TPA: DUF6443 domain-containing protein, partial [Flavisolibacter sp.]|nr:DUF6443 domain-containing protein [Flavisolibacter sp.]
MKRLAFAHFSFLVLFLLPVFCFSQGTNMSNPIVMGTYSAGTYSYNDSRNTSSYGNDYGQSSPDIFYKFTVNGTTTINVSTCGSGWDTYLWILDANGNEVIRDDDNGAACSGSTASIVIPSTQTTLTSLAAGTYYIVAEGYSSNTGTVNLSISLTVQGAVTYNTKNFIRSWDATAPLTDPAAITNKGLREVKQTTEYFDGLGRPLQSVVKQGSWTPVGAIYDYLDLVTPFEYDNFGKETKKYLPYVGNTNTGSYYDNAITDQQSFNQNFFSAQGENSFYSQIDYEPSPLNRVAETFAPGQNWAGTHGNADPLNRHSVKTAYYNNTINDAVRKWDVSNVANDFGTISSPGTYDPGTLYKTATTDEQGHQVIEFKDKEGKVILKKVQLTAVSDDGTVGKDHTGWLCTYYVYDDLGQLRCVIQPKAVQAMNSPGTWILDATMLKGLCFRYEYDTRGRMIMKQVPGAGAVYMVYDKRDRLTMTQDANMRANQWLVTIYDDLNRPIKTGRWTDANTLSYHLSQATSPSSSYYYPFNSEPTSNWELLTETHYDDYNGLPAGLSSTLYNSGYGSYLTSSSSSPDYADPITQSTAVKGIVTWTKVKVLNSNPILYISSCNIYDDKGRIIQTQSINVTQGLDVATIQYNFSGQVLRSHIKHQNAGSNAQTFDVATLNNYDEWGKVINVSKNVNNTGWKQISMVSYNEMGQVKQKSLGNDVSAILNYEYNVRGWLLGMNRAYVNGTSSTGYFGFDLGYDKANSAVIGASYAPFYNGNIAGTIWK